MPLLHGYNNPTKSNLGTAMPLDSIMSWGAAGMAGWGSTCGVAIDCALFSEIALPRAVTNGVIDKLLAHYAEGLHPLNEAWFINGKTHTRAATSFQKKYGSLQCHNVVVTHRTDADFLAAGGGNADLARSEFCSTLVGAMCYETIKQVGAVKAGLTIPAFTPFSTTRSSCNASGCHDAANLPGGYLPKEDCLACHK